MKTVFRMLALLVLLAARPQPHALFAQDSEEPEREIIPQFAEGQYEGELCALPFNVIDGQRVRIGGVAHGENPVPDYLPIADIAASLPAAGSEPTVIIIIDFFNDAGSSDIGYTHGDLVYTYTQDVLSEAVSPVALDAINIDSGQDTFAINDDLRLMLQRYREQGYQRFVINMSFALIPCDLITTVQAYTEGAEVQNFAQQMHDTLIVGDPLITSLTREYCPEYGNVAYVAASGNAGLPFPFYPAAFDEVLAVGALDIFGNPAPYSNLGEVDDIGAVFSSIINDGIEGTSFAAPTTSIRLAHDLSSGAIEDACGMVTGGSTTGFILFDSAFPSFEFFSGYEVSEDGLTWTLFLNEMTLPSGNPVVAGLVVEEFLAIAADLFGSDAPSIEVVDDLTLMITFVYPEQAAELMDALSGYEFTIMD